MHAVREADRRLIRSDANTEHRFDVLLYSSYARRVLESRQANLLTTEHVAMDAWSRLRQDEAGELEGIRLLAGLEHHQQL